MKTTEYLDKKHIQYSVSADGKITVLEDLIITGDVVMEDLERVSGYVDVRQNATFTAPALTEVSGYVGVRQNATFTAPALTEVSGYVDVGENATFTAPALTKSGYVDVRQNATFTAPALTEVSGYVGVRQNATFTAPALTKSGYVDVGENATFTAPALTEVSGYVGVRQNATFTAPALTKSGYVDVGKNATFTAPALTKSGYVDVRQNATFTAPALTEVSGYVDVGENATFTAPALTKSGYVDVRQNATFTAPALTEVSGYVVVRQNATFTAPALTCVEHVLMEGEFFGKQITVIDEIGCVILSTKKQDDVTIRYCQKSAFKNRKLVGDKFYIASNGSYNAHAETIKLALEELAFKSGNRDISKYRNMSLDAKKTPAEWAFVYRMVTGACQYGTKMFMESKGKLKKTYKLSEIIEQTKGAYGNDKFCQIVAGKEAA